MTKNTVYEDGSLYFQHFSFRKDYLLDDKNDFEFIEEKYNMLLDLDHSASRQIHAPNRWICPDCGEITKRSYKEIVYGGFECLGEECDNGSAEGIEDRQWKTCLFECIECGEEHNFSILCGHHYAKAHRKDPNIIAHDYRRETRRMVIAAGWKPYQPLRSLLFPCHVCKQDNTAPKTIKSHWEWNHSELDLEQFKIDFFVSMGIERRHCRWCGELTPPCGRHIGFDHFHKGCKDEHRKNAVRRSIGRRNPDGQPIDEDMNVVSEDELIYF